MNALTLRIHDEEGDEGNAETRDFKAEMEEMLKEFDDSARRISYCCTLLQGAAQVDELQDADLSGGLLGCTECWLLAEMGHASEAPFKHS